MGPLLFLALPALFGLPLACVGLIVRLCEWSWEKPAGSMGSTGLLLISGILCFPVVAYLIWAVIANVVSTGSPWGAVHSPPLILALTFTAPWNMLATKRKTEVAVRLPR